MSHAFDALVDLVNPLQGTDSAEDFSRGSTLPLVCTPFPMTAWTLQTAGASRWCFRWRDALVEGIRATHQPSPWVGDYGWFTLMPQAGPRLGTPREWAAGYDRQRLQVGPDYMNVAFPRYGCAVELAPTPRCALLRLRFAGARRGRLVVNGTAAGLRRAPDGLITGITTANDGGVVAAGFAVTFAIRTEAKGVELYEAAGHYGIEFDVPEGGAVLVRVATSFLGEEQARLNLERETGGQAFEDVRARARAAWADRLGRLAVEGEGARTAYSCLYRTLTFPQTMHEPDAAGSPVHWSPYVGGRREGVMFGGHGFWDTYRTVYPLYALLFPDDYASFLEGWLNAARQGGWFPRWPCLGYRACMLGTHVDPVFADARAKGIAGAWEWAEAYRLLRRHAFEDPGKDDLGYGRPGLADYLELGYLPADRHAKSVAATLDHAYCDFCLSELAEATGAAEDARELRRRAQNYRHLYDPSSGLMRGRLADGRWLEPFDEFEWGGPYVEGGPWQTSWGVPHDVEGLIELHGGRAAFLARLERMLALPPVFRAGDYPIEIHEMTEMAAAAFGQYAHSNQPVHHVLYLFAQAGAPERTDFWVRRVLAETYHDGVGGFPGDEDNGEMSAWYLLSALGLFPACPGKPEYVGTFPLFPEAEVRLGSGERLRCVRPPDAIAGTKPAIVTLNGALQDRNRLSHQQVLKGGVLQWRA